VRGDGKQEVKEKGRTNRQVGKNKSWTQTRESLKGINRER
jgi:hypothetical protein